MKCNRCDGTGFLNIGQVPPDTADSVDSVLRWMAETTEPHDVAVCDCCGDGESWYGDPGEHGPESFGPSGPYGYNGGLPECA